MPTNVIAIVSQHEGAIVTTSPLGYSVNVTFQATDGVTVSTFSINIAVPAGVGKTKFNDTIIQAVVNSVPGFNGNWVLDPRDFFFQPYENG